MSSVDQQRASLSPPRGPRHVAIIMDGNGRWAEREKKSRSFGHKAGVKAVRRAVSFAVKQQLDALTLYAFSSENWCRPNLEVNALMGLFVEALADAEVKKLDKNNIRLRIIGDTSRFNQKLQDRIKKSETLTKNNSGLKLNIAANYGGRWDVIQSVRELAKQVQNGTLLPDGISEKSFESHICLGEQAPVDLVIRTGGEHRISNFLLWQIAYAELYFTDVLWPDFGESDFKTALQVFAQRERRFGGTIPTDAGKS